MPYEVFSLFSRCSETHGAHSGLDDAAACFAKLTQRYGGEIPVHPISQKHVHEIAAIDRKGDQRQLLLPVDDNYSCRSSGVTIWYRRYRIGYRSAGNGTEAEANGRQESASVGRGIGDERADVTDVASRQGAIGEEGQETVANSTGPVRRGMGRGGRAPSAERR